LNPTKAATDMQRAIKERDYELVLELYEKLLASDAAVTQLAFLCILEAKSVLEGQPSAKETMAALMEKSPDLVANAQTYEALFKAMEGGANKTESHDLYQELLSKGITPSVQIYNTLVSIFCAAKDYDGAQAFFAEMRVKGVNPTRYTFYRYINGCFRGNEAERAYLMLCAAEEQWRTPDVQSYTRMIRHFMRLDHFEGEMRCLQGIMAVDPGTSAETIVLGLLEYATQNNHIDKVTHIYELAKEAGVSLNRNQLIRLVNVMLQQERPVDAFTVATQVMLSGHKVPLTASKMLADGLSKQAQLVDEAYYQLENRRTRGESVPLDALNLVIEACARLSDLDRAFATFQEFEAFKLEPDTATYNALLSTCLACRETSSARKLVNTMLQKGTPLDGESFGHRCSLFVMSRDEDGAEAMLRECREAGKTPSPKMYHTLINIHMRRATYDPRNVVQHATLAKELLDDMKSSSMRINPDLERRIASALEGNVPEPRQQRR